MIFIAVGQQVEIYKRDFPLCFWGKNFQMVIS